jgi:anti-sigma B factor antagonist
MAWKVKALQDEGKGIVEIAGVVDSTNVEDFFTFLTSVYKSGIIRIILDLKNTSYLSSAGLSVIMDTFNKAQRDGGKLVIARASHMVKDLFRLVQFVKIMEFYDNLDDAINAI